MNQPQIDSKVGENFAVAALGKFSQLDRFGFEIKEKSIEFEGKIFLKQLLNLTSAEISLNNLLPRKSIPFYHKHRLNEEIYIFVSGEGEFQVDGRIFPVCEGTVVRVDPEGERCIRNISDTEKLCWIVVQSRAGSHSDHTIEDGFGLPKRVSWQNKQRI
jgi:mannose-6-phosphate isomerase-like protein (cupin superfamily)